MKQIEFPLVKAVRLVPMSGVSNVVVSTTGSVLISDGEAVEPRPKQISLAETRNGELKCSPQGLFHTVKIRLPYKKASRAEFHSQVDSLFDEYIINGL